MSVPYVFSVEEMVEYFVYSTEDPSAEDVETAGWRLGRNYYPALVADLHNEGLLTAEVAAVVVPSAWVAVEHPNRALERGVWRALFSLFGYTVDGNRAAQPTVPLRLYRGADREHRLGWSWTEDYALAQWFAQRPIHRAPGQVWTVLVPPELLLARITQHRSERQYVVEIEPLADQVRTARGS